MGLTSGDSSSSGEEDGDAEWRAAIDSVANGFTPKSAKTDGDLCEEGEESGKPKPLKHYQIKAQKLLEEILDKRLEVVNDPVPVSADEPMVQEGGIRLFRRAPLGIASEPIDEFSKPRKRPKILPGEVADEKSKKFRRQLRCVSVEGIDIIAAAKDACQKSLARFEAKNAAAEAAKKREEERVAELKKIRGEKWLPSIAKIERQLTDNMPNLGSSASEISNLGSSASEISVFPSYIDKIQLYTALSGHFKFLWPDYKETLWKSVGVFFTTGHLEAQGLLCTSSATNPTY